MQFDSKQSTMEAAPASADHAAAPLPPPPPVPQQASWVQDESPLLPLHPPTYELKPPDTEK